MQNKVGIYNIKLGDRLQHLDEMLEGTVVEIKANTTVLRTSEGFDYEFNYNELVWAPGAMDRDVMENSRIDIDIQEKEGSGRKKLSKKRKKGQTPVPEYDLHIDKILDKYRGMSNGEILQFQLNFASQKLEWSIANKIPKIVFIHGVGEGVLKQELRDLCRRYPKLDPQDANPREYGQGATLVYIRQR